MKQNIFQNEQKNDNKILLFKNKSKWCFKKNNKSYYLTPSIFNSVNLSPHILIPENIINYSCDKNNVKSEKIIIKYDIKEFIECHIRLTYEDTLLDGWIYNISPEKNIYKDLENKKVWTCNYANYFYKELPKEVYLSLESF